MHYTVKTAGDQSIIIYFGEQISKQTSQTLQKLSNIIESSGIIGVEEVILGYTTILIHYAPTRISFHTLINTIKAIIMDVDLAKTDERNTIEIPVLYGEELGPDLANVARLNNLSEQEVIKLHTEPDYTVYFLGFSPGFPFLGGLDERIATPRLENPRKKVQAGSVGIANHQTGIYPVTSPGGWQIIGHTPIPLFNPSDDNPFLLSPGDIITFKPITKIEYDEIINSQI